jgi:hypothetical protein
MKELIERLRWQKRYTVGIVPVTMGEAADALERLTRGDVALPEPDVINKYPTPGHYTEQKILDYGNRRAAAAVLADEALMRECLEIISCMTYATGTVDKLKARLGEK